MLLINNFCLIFSGCTFPCTLKPAERQMHVSSGKHKKIFQKLVFCELAITLYYFETTKHNNVKL